MTKASLTLALPALHGSLTPLDAARWDHYDFIMPYIQFVWDDQKGQANARKHEVTFEEAKSAFFDPDARVIHDPDHSGEEDRFILVGMSRRLRVLTVCHCFREQDEVIRIISARRATRREQNEYGNARR